MLWQGCIHLLKACAFVLLRLSFSCVWLLWTTGALVDSDQGEDASESDEDTAEWAEDPMVAQLSTLRCSNGSLCLSASVTVSCKPQLRLCSMWSWACPGTCAREADCWKLSLKLT